MSESGEGSIYEQKLDTHLEVVIVIKPILHLDFFIFPYLNVQH